MLPNWRRTATGIGLALMTLLILARARLLNAQSGCTNPPYDMSYIIASDYDGCGSNQWELQATDARFIYDRGTASVIGFCGGNYNDCSCNYVPPYERPGNLSFSSAFDYDQYDFWWDATDYEHPTYHLCNGSCSGYQEEPNYYTEDDLGYGYTEPCD